MCFSCYFQLNSSLISITTNLRRAWNYAWQSYHFSPTPFIFEISVSVSNDRYSSPVCVCIKRSLLFSSMSQQDWASWFTGKTEGIKSLRFLPQTHLLAFTALLQVLPVPWRPFPTSIWGKSLHQTSASPSSYVLKSLILSVLDSGHKEGWVPKNWCFQTVVLKTLESPLDSKEIKPVNPKGNQPCIFTGRTDAEAKAPILWLCDGKSWLIGKDPDAGKGGGQEEKGVTEDEMVGWHHWLNGCECEQT